MKRSLGEGGQAQTFLVVGNGDDEKKEFVLKRLKNKNRIDRFRKEIEAGLSISHPNVVQVVDFDLDSDPPYLVTEYYPGGTLSQIALHQLAIIDRLGIFAAICRGVGHAHNNGIIHRDLKPDNIFLREDKTTPVVGDFGICFLTEEGERFTVVDEVVGNRFCTAPELEGGRADKVLPTSDVYCLGKLLYWMIGGRSVPRELHRDSKYDLRKEQKDSAIFFVYELLDKMIVEDASKRFTDGNEVATAVDVAIRRLQVNAHIPNLTIPQLCDYCGLGEYQPIVNPYSALPGWDQGDSVMGFLRIGAGRYDPQREAWLILACDYCGNVQVFRPDKAQDRDIWRK